MRVINETSPPVTSSIFSIMFSKNGHQWREVWRSNSREEAEAFIDHVIGQPWARYFNKVPLITTKKNFKVDNDQSHP